ncbi:hypothetical protein PIB30_066301, partial [Stylosanthes scabra]|nr:hypothetical protein [Stylosanthes scabra]
MFATTLLLNADLAEVKEFRQRLVKQGIVTTQPLVVGAEGKLASMEEDFLRLSKKCTIEELHEKNEDGSFVVSGTISDVLQEGPWWYSGCSCGKSVRPRSGAYYCDSCGSHFTQVTP